MAGAGTAGSERQLAPLAAVAREEVVEVLGRLGLGLLLRRNMKIGILEVNFGVCAV